jgi:hypothetical protein
MRMAEATRTPVDSRRRKRRSDLLIVGGVLTVLAGALAYAARDAWTEPADRPIAIAKPQAKPVPKSAKPAGAVSELVDDDGQTLWVSPTDGPPLDLAYLPPGVEIILALRPEAVADHPEGDKIIDAVKPVAHAGIKFASDTFPDVVGVKQLVVGWEFKADGRWRATLVARLSGHDSAQDYLAKHFPNAAKKTYRETTCLLRDRCAYYAPSDDPMVLVAAPEGSISDIIALDGNSPPLRRDLERLLLRTDASRHLTIMVSPHLLLRQDDTLFHHEMLPMQAALEWFLGDELGAACLSLNWDENFFIELVAVPTLDSSPERMSDELAGRVVELPDLVEEFVLGLSASPYGRRVVARLPEMVRRLAAYTRHGFDEDCAVLRCYLPAVAGHNLLMGAELVLAEGQGGGERAVAPPVAAATSIVERLTKKTSLRFAREELEAALNMFAQDVGVEIVIRGQDLQLDGITRNQLFGIDMSDMPAAEILVEMLRRANPDKLATGAADPRQKLVYVVGPEAIFITTRARAAERGEPLPAIFQEK